LAFCPTYAAFFDASHYALVLGAGALSAAEIVFEIDEPSGDARADGDADGYFENEHWVGSFLSELSRRTISPMRDAPFSGSRFSTDRARPAPAVPCL
jgi:hypothetical protein